MYIFGILQHAKSEKARERFAVRAGPSLYEDTGMSVVEVLGFK